jgi:cytochrome c2
MCRTYRLVLVAFIFLSACGEGTDKNKGNKAINQPAQQTKTDKLTGGSDLFSRYVCFTCHSLEGKVMYGPPLNDLFMKEVTVERQGKEKTIVADREYFTRAITDPDYEKVLEYKSKTMPKPAIPKDDIETLIDYLIGLGEKE